MKVTSDSLFHFTTSLAKLKGILSEKFQLTYCHEKYELDYETHDSYYPMVSFCDIPLSLAKDQIKKYGSFAIGMNKEWGIKNNLNPVVYIEKDSLLAKDIQSSIDNMSKAASAMSIIAQKNTLQVKKTVIAALQEVQTLIKNFNHDTKQQALSALNDAVKEISTNSQTFKQLTDPFIEASQNSYNLFRYIKNYRGPLKRGNITFKNYRFYDEREWRYIPTIKDERLKKSLKLDEYREYRGTKKEKKFIPNINLSFSGTDIKYLIVRSERDVPKLIKSLRSINNLTNNSVETDILSTKILTVEQLNSDF
ncbi:MAG: abortive infection system antitoxin AbiGi family protein [Ferruginibacter sp.]